MALNYTKTNTFSTGTTIASSAVNANFDDVVNAFTGLENQSKTFSNLTVDTILRSSGTFQAPNGTGSLPTFTFTNDTNSGMYLIGAGDVGFATAGAKKFEFTSSTITCAIPIAMGTNKITGLGSGTASTDAATIGNMRVQQIVTATSTTVNTTTSSTLQNSSLAVTITPTSASNRVLLIVNGMIEIDASAKAMTLSIKRGTGNIGGSFGFGYWRTPTGSTSWQAVPCFHTVDSPSTTSATTYTLAFASNDNSTTVTWGVDTGATQQITAIEVI